MLIVRLFGNIDVYNIVHIKGGVRVGFIRVGDKLINKEKLSRAVDRILTLRSSGLSQQDVAEKIGVDRTFISRLEALAEVRKGGPVAVIGFPLQNKQELLEVCKSYGVEYTLLMTEKERWEYIEAQSGLEFLNHLMEIISELQDFDVVIMIGSDMRIRLIEAMLGDKVVGIEIGESPIKEDITFPADKLIKLISNVKGGRR